MHNLSNLIHGVPAFGPTLPVGLMPRLRFATAEDVQVTPPVTDPAPTDPPTDPAPAPTTPPAPAPAPAPTPGPGPQQQPAPAPTAEVKPGDMDALPAWARKAITDANDEAAKARVSKKDAEKAAYRKVGIELGIIEPDEGELTPEQIAERLRTENESIKAENATLKAGQVAQKKRDVIAAASTTHKADTPLMTAWLNSLDEFTTLDPNADDYSARVAELVLREVTSNPKLAAVRVAPQSGGDDTPTGDPTPDGDLTVDQIRENRRKRREGR